MTLARTKEGRGRAGDAGKAGRDRKYGIQVLMFPSCFENGLKQNLADLPLIKDSEPHVAPERVDRVRLDLHRGQRAVLAESVHVRVGVLQRSNRTDGQRTKVKIVPAADERAQLCSLGATGGKSTQARAARMVAVVAAVDGGIEINPVVGPGRVDPASSAIDINTATRLERGPGVRVLAHHPNRQLIGDSVIDTKADSAGGEIVPVGVRIGVHADKVTKPSHPHTPAVLRSRLENWFHNCFG